MYIAHIFLKINACHQIYIEKRIIIQKKTIFLVENVGIDQYNKDNYFSLLFAKNTLFSETTDPINLFEGEM